MVNKKKGVLKNVISGGMYPQNFEPGRIRPPSPPVATPMHSVNISCHFSKFLKIADDVKVLRTVESGQDQDAFQSDLDKMFKWPEDWQMEFNLKMCKIMLMGHGASV